MERSDSQKTEVKISWPVNYSKLNLDEELYVDWFQAIKSWIKVRSKYLSDGSPVEIEEGGYDGITKKRTPNDNIPRMR